MSNKFLYKGTKVEFIAKFDNKDIKLDYLLVESFEPDFVFQLVCIDGYYSGNVSGFIKREKIVDNVGSITKKHLITELKRNFLGFKVRSLVIREKE